MHSDSHIHHIYVCAYACVQMYAYLSYKLMNNILTYLGVAAVVSSLNLIIYMFVYMYVYICMYAYLVNL